MAKPTDYNLQSLRAFLEVSASGSMTAAAAKLGLTQSAVSQAIRQLEESFGAVLVDRSRRPLALTAAGSALQRRAQPLIQEAEALGSIVRRAGLTKLPELRVGAVDSFAATAGPRVIRGLLRMTSQLSFRSGLARDQAAALQSRQVDMIVSSDALDDVDDLDRYHLLDEPYLLLMPRRLRDRLNKLDVRELAANHSLIRFSARSHVGAQIERQLRRMGVKAPRLLEVDATDALVAMLTAELGWAIATPLCMLQVKASLAGIEAVAFPGPGFVRQLHLVARTGEYGDLPQKVADLARAALRDDCLPEMRRLVPWLKNQVAVGDGRPH
jgi:DNA-binding transcriptional LysR family regulator